MQKSDWVTTTSLETEQSGEILVPRHCTLSGFTEAKPLNSKDSMSVAWPR